VNAERIAEAASGVLEQFDLELDDVEIKPAGRHTVLRIVVDGDGPQGTGPGLDDIAEATNAVSAALDAADAVGSQSYRLEVTSRGTDRPLTLPRHWRRNRGRMVSVSLAGDTSLTGRIVDAGECCATVETMPDDRREVAYDQVSDARIQVELSKRKH
jgi:ribosome maturation factor RimP